VPIVRGVKSFSLRIVVLEVDWLRLQNRAVDFDGFWGFSLRQKGHAIA
jgi:hypothetical protein